MQGIQTKVFKLMPLHEIIIHTDNEDDTYTATTPDIRGLTNQCIVQPIQISNCTYWVFVKMI
jgi:hypothetical protein